MDDQRTERESGGTRLIVSLMLLACGISAFVYVCKVLWTPHVYHLDGIQKLLWFSSGAMIGAGVSCPFRQTIRGALIGLAVQTALAMFDHFILSGLPLGSG